MYTRRLRVSVLGSGMLLALVLGAGCGASDDDVGSSSGASGAGGSNGQPGSSGRPGSSGQPGSSGGVPADACAAATTPPLDVVDASGAIVPENYRLLAGQYGADAGLRYRFGEDASCYHSTPLSPAAMYQPPDRICMAAGNYGSGFLYQVGPESCPADDVGDFSSTQGIALYTPDRPDDGGVNVLQVLSQGYDVYQSKPQTSWTFGSPIPWQLDDPAWTATNGAKPSTPIATARSYRMPNGEQNVEALTVFQSGLIGAFGENTGNNGHHDKLPAGLVPTAIALTNGNEFALVTLWDPATTTGKLAVYAMASCEESSEPMCLAKSSLLSTYAIQHQPYPGFVNNASYTGSKLLGLIDLPEMHAPTAISATSHYQSGWWTKNGANTVASLFDFGNEADRQTFVSGENAGKYSTAGFATVLSLSEKKALFVDLTPLFAYYAKMYFSDAASFQATRALGPGPHEWPYTFADTPEQLPRLVSTVTLADRPTAVVTTRFKAKAGDPGYDALVTTRDGTLVSYAVGGLVDGSGADPAAIRAVGSLRVGLNPTAMTYRKAHVWSGNDPFSDNPTSVTRDEVIVVARGDRELDFVKMDATGAAGAVYERLTDAVLQDPIAVEDSDTHGTESYLLTVADFGARQIVNYRFGPVIMHTNGGARHGMGADGNARFERGGTFAVAGRPFAFSSANVP